MERSMFNSIISITTALIILVSSFFLWQQFNNEEGMLIAESYGELPLSIKDNNYDNFLYGESIQEEEIIINYKNMNNINRKEKFYLIVDTTSSINELDLSFTINGTKYNINELKSEINNGYRCYFIETLNFNAYEEKKLNINFERKNDISNNSYILYSFQII